MSNEKSSRRDLHADITSQLIAAIEADPGQPSLPWRRVGGALHLPTNALTGKAYNGINILNLWVTAEQRGFGAPIWGTYRQWAELGAQVRRGEKSSLVVFYKEFETDPDPDVGDDNGKRRVARASYVFNASQVDGYAAPEQPKSLGPVERIARADALVASTQALVCHGGDRAYYVPRNDYIQMPDEGLFTGTGTLTRSEGYYATLVHELVHWTGAKHRLAREMGKRFAAPAPRRIKGMMTGRPIRRAKRGRGGNDTINSPIFPKSHSIRKSDTGITRQYCPRGLKRFLFNNHLGFGMPSGVSTTLGEEAHVTTKDWDADFAARAHVENGGYDGFIPSPTTEQDNASDGSGPTKSDKAVEALLSDWRRQEGVLERDHFDRVVLKRKLDAEEIIEVLHRLKAEGVSLKGLESEEEVEDDVKVEESSIRGDFVKGFGKASLLRHDEHVKLARAVQIGLLAQRDLDAGYGSEDIRKLIREGEAAKSKMVVANLRLVFKIARKFGNGSLEFTDHVQNGTIGLMRAVELFDPELGLKFSTYATWWVRQSIWRGNDNDSHLIRVPVHQIEKIRKFRRMVRRLTVETGREPNLTELAEALDWPKDKVAFLERLAMFRTTSLDVPIDDEDGASVGSLIPSDAPSPEQLAAVSSRDKLLRSLITTLSPREQLVLDRRFGLSSRDGETLQEVGTDFGVTRERIRQIEDKALKKLYRKALRHVKALGDD